MVKISPRLQLIKSYINSLDNNTTITVRKWPDGKVTYKYKCELIKQLINIKDPIIRNTDYGYIILISNNPFCSSDFDFVISLCDIIPFIYQND